MLPRVGADAPSPPWFRLRAAPPWAYRFLSDRPSPILADRDASQGRSWPVGLRPARGAWAVAGGAWVAPPAGPRARAAPPVGATTWCHRRRPRSLGEIAGQAEPDLAAIQQRLKQGADPNDRLEFWDQGRAASGAGMRWAPLYWAAIMGHAQVVDALVNAGAELGWKDCRGLTALHRAAEGFQGDTNVGAVRVLAARGGKAAVNEGINFLDMTPLHVAAYHGRSTAVVQALLEAGADASLTDGDGNTALEGAVSLGRTEVAACIRQADEARQLCRLCGARQRLAFATSMLPSAEATSTAGLGEVAHDLMSSVGEALLLLLLRGRLPAGGALGPPSRLPVPCSAGAGGAGAGEGVGYEEAAAAAAAGGGGGAAAAGGGAAAAGAAAA